MSSNFFPILSSSPPPIDDAESPDNDEEEEEFSTFASADNTFECSPDSPVSKKEMSPTVPVSESQTTNGDVNAQSDFEVQTFQNKVFSPGEKSPNHKQSTETKTDSIYNNPSRCNSELIGNGVGLTEDLSETSFCDVSNEHSAPVGKSDETHNVNTEFASEVNNATDHLGISNTSQVFSTFTECDTDLNLPSELLKKCNFTCTYVKESLDLSENDSELQLDVNQDRVRTLEDDSLNLHQIDDFRTSYEENDIFLTETGAHEDDVQHSKKGSCSDTSIANSPKFVNKDCYDKDSTEFYLPNSINSFSEFKIGVQSKLHENTSDGLFVAKDMFKAAGETDLSIDEDNELNCQTYLTSNNDVEIHSDFQECNSDSDNHFQDSDWNQTVVVQDSNNTTFYNSEGNVIGISIPCKSDNEYNDENFGNFETFKSFSPDAFNKSQCKESSFNVNFSANDEFADFQTSTFSCEKSVEQPSTADFDLGKDDEFADFESATFKSESNEQCQSLEASPFSSFQESEKGLGRISKVINALFPISADSSELDVLKENECDVLMRNAKSHRLWDKLHEVEQTPGLRFQWPVSHTFQQLLRSVNVDYHSILRTSSVPFFASGLSLLEPTKGPVQVTANKQSEDPSQSPKDPIPPVQFDWSSSGLVNPLDLGQSASILMDLSFLNSSEAVTSNNGISKDFSLENELLKPSPAEKEADLNPKSQLLEQLLSLTDNSSIHNPEKIHRPSWLSQEANSVLDQLPDLSFMQAKVLMFPISSNTS